jgi:hypothetical protein
MYPARARPVQDGEDCLALERAAIFPAPFAIRNNRPRAILRCGGRRLAHIPLYRRISDKCFNAMVEKNEGGGMREESLHRFILHPYFINLCHRMTFPA